jgi:hypothetical protein
MEKGTRVKLKSSEHHGANRHGIPHGQSLKETVGTVVGTSKLRNPQVHWDGTPEDVTPDVARRFLERA